MDIKYDWNDITIVPAELSDISSRSEISVYYNNNRLPLFTAPMDTVISENNAEIFHNNGLNICIPRGCKTTNKNYFQSYGLDEIIDIIENNKPIHNKVLIDIANAHMKKLYDTAKK